MVEYQPFKLLSPLFDTLQRLSVYASMVSSWNSSWECDRCANRRRAANAPAAPAAIAKTVAEAINALFIMLLLLSFRPRTFVQGLVSYMHRSFYFSMLSVFQKYSYRGERQHSSHIHNWSTLRTRGYRREKDGRDTGEPSSDMQDSPQKVWIGENSQSCPFAVCE